MERRAPRLEGVALATLVAATMAAGGETLRASYHGYLHTAIGEAVLREGLLPENPYHAGAPLRYYTLYPLLGVLLGRVGVGPLWGFALLGVLASLLFAPALDALGRALGLDFRARRAGFLGAVLGFGALGWIGLLTGRSPPWGAAPVRALDFMTGAGAPWAWDPRLASFVTKPLNASSFALAIPFALWSMAAAASPNRRARRAIPPGALALALNPMVGGVAALCVAGWKLPDLVHGDWRHRLAWPGAGIAACLLALPFLLPAVAVRPPDGPDLFPVRLRGPPALNLLGPTALLLIPGILGLWAWEKRSRNLCLWAIATPVLLLFLTHGRLPFGNEYKLARLAGLLWSLPVGVWAGRALERRSAIRHLPFALLAIALPSFGAVLYGYLTWGSAQPAPGLETRDGRLAVPAERADAVLPVAILSAEREAPPEAVLLLHPMHPGSRSAAEVVQGNALAPLLRHPLVVDLPQIHNARQPDLERRIELAVAFWLGRGAEAIRSKRPPDGELTREERAKALRELRALLPDRPMLVIVPRRLEGVSGILRRQAQAPPVEAGGFSLWRLPPLGS